MRFPIRFDKQESMNRVPGSLMAKTTTLISGILLVLWVCLLATAGMAADTLLYSTDLTYVGSFRVPSGTFGASSFDFSGLAMTYYSGHNSLFISGRVQNPSFFVAEISIPTPKTGSVSGLNTASVLQNFVDPTEGHSGDIMANGGCCIANGVKTGGFLVYGNKLIGTSYSYYDPEPYYAVRSHYTSGLTLSTTGDFSGMYELSGLPLTKEGTNGASFASGWMAEIPSAYQSFLGKTHLTGNGALNKINRTSWGPSAFAVNLGQLGSTVPLPATPLMYYTEVHPSIGKWDSTAGTYQTVWNGAGHIGGMIWPPGSRSILYFGMVGTGAHCYGTGADCGDPLNQYQGTHAYPYVFRVWAYDANDFIAAKNGTKNPWEVVTYSSWNFTSPYGVTDFSDLGSGGVAYDPGTKHLFIAQPRVDGDRPVINVYSVNVDSTPPPPLVPSPPTGLHVSQ
jgi:hypothetical protein